MSNGSDTSYTLAYNHRIAGIAANHDLLNATEEIPVEMSVAHTYATALGSNCIGFNP
jgi:hypothetical protein